MHSRMRLTARALLMFLSLAAGAVRPTDGLIFKSRAAQRLFAEVGEHWAGRFGFMPLAGLRSEVIPNGVDAEVNQRSDLLRRQTRDRFGIDDADVVYLSFSRAPLTKECFM